MQNVNDFVQASMSWHKHNTSFAWGYAIKSIHIVDSLIGS